MISTDINKSIGDWRDLVHLRYTVLKSYLHVINFNA